MKKTSNVVMGAVLAISLVPSLVVADTTILLVEEVEDSNSKVCNFGPCQELLEADLIFCDAYDESNGPAARKACYVRAMARHSTCMDKQLSAAELAEPDKDASADLHENP
ncbi:MAG: hypothetical protein FE835_16290 [Gammaproteobacteria bacterium]|nr:hypothetical protein [Gammaproteobacteria bacterium]